MKAREARKNQVNTVIKEMKLRPKIDPHDYETKKGHVVRFLKAGDKVKITIMFRGREQSRPELGFRLLQRLADGRRGARLRRVRAQAGRPQHDHGARPAPEEGRGTAEREAETRQRADRRGRGSRPRRRDRARRLPRPRPHRATRSATDGDRRPEPDRARPTAATARSDEETRRHAEEQDAQRRQEALPVTGTGKVMREQANRRHLLEAQVLHAHPPPGGGRRRRPRPTPRRSSACSAC